MDVRDLDRAMASMAQALSGRVDVDSSLDRIVRAAAETVPGADEASITVRHADGHLETTAATSDLVVLADELQYELREGPCYDAVTGNDHVSYSRDLARDTQWPNFGPRVAQLGLLSQMALRLVTVGHSATGLNLYSQTRRAFEDHDGLPQLFASHAKVALGYATQLQSLRGALGTRATIGKAIGIIMERYALTDERAFDFLIRMSQTTNTKLRDVAQEIVGLGPSTRQ
jgi:hypothetical protein